MATWGRAAVIAVAAVNLVGGAISLVQGMDGAVIGLVVAGLGLVLGLLAPGTAVEHREPSLG